MVTLQDLTAGAARLRVAPELGGAIAMLEVAGKPVLRRWNGDTHDPFSMGSIVLAPFANRISGNQFTWRGETFTVAPNVAGQPLALHGDAFQNPWSFDHSATGATLRLHSGAIGPWRYSAQKDVLLGPDAVTLSLQLRNEGTATLPFGAGFHPWFPRDDKTRLQFSARTVWMEDDTHLPTKELGLAQHKSWCFAGSRPLPSDWINACYTGWDGLARLDQGPDFVSCRLKASANAPFAMLYSPGDSSGFFCLEPVTHSVDALNQDGDTGLIALAPGETMSVSFSIEWGNTT